MKAIIIEEARFYELRELLELESLKARKPSGLDVSQITWEAALREVHRAMNYQFVKWAHSHGADCINR